MLKPTAMKPCRSSEVRNLPATGPVAQPSARAPGSGVRGSSVCGGAVPLASAPRARLRAQQSCARTHRGVGGRYQLVEPSGLSRARAFIAGACGASRSGAVWPCRRRRRQSRFRQWVRAHVGERQARAEALARQALLAAREHTGAPAELTTPTRTDAGMCFPIVTQAGATLGPERLALSPATVIAAIRDFSPSTPADARRGTTALASRRLDASHCSSGNARGADASRWRGPSGLGRQPHPSWFTKAPSERHTNSSSAFGNAWLMRGCRR